MAQRDQAAVSFIGEARRASTMLHPLRLGILERLREPGSASTLARGLSLPRQKINYHLRELEKQGLVELVEERRKGNCVERVVRATARSYLVNPEALGQLAADPESIHDRFSASYLVAVASRAISDIAQLRARADKTRKRVASFTLQSEVRFSSPAQQNAFAEELANLVSRLVAKYNDEHAPGGRRFRFFAAAYPKVARKSS
jgi:DNA-binding transcriptional ArsR family regulator